MGNGLAALANGLWLASGWADYRAFRRALHHPATAQRDVLRRILGANTTSEFGRDHDFARITQPHEFQQRVAPADYDAFAPLIARMASGEANVLTTEPVKLFEPSSGSTAASKLIPYTAALQREFQRGLAAWIGNLYISQASLMAGPAYWSVTPLTEGKRTTAGGIPIGFASDSDYLGPLGRLVEAVLAVPNGVKQLGEMEAFRYATLRHLLDREGLRLISVWNPTFLTLLLDALVVWWEPLLDDMARGTLTLPETVPAALAQELRRGLRPAWARAQRLRPLDPRDPATLAQVWPKLCVVSAWADGPAARFARQLQQRLPHVTLQPKGLLATEALVSLPWGGAPAPVLAVTAHFLEFMDADGRIRLAHELVRGGVYAVIVTTGGGLYRYQLRDQVEVVGHVAATPCIRFLGKGDRVADWFGEKLSEPFVTTVVEQVLAQATIVPRFVLFAPADLPDGFAYTLYLEAETVVDCAQAAQALDAALCANFHYAYCRRLGQLGPARVQRVVDGAAIYLAVVQQRGVKLGNIKPALLDREPVWDDAFRQSVVV